MAANHTESGKTYFGFLMVDHHWSDYFYGEDGEDVSILSAIGDALTVAFFAQWQYTVYSRTYREATELKKVPRDV